MLLGWVGRVESERERGQARGGGKGARVGEVRVCFVNWVVDTRGRCGGIVEFGGEFIIFFYLCFFFYSIF